MSKKEITYDIEARQGLQRGVDALADAVKVTLGPKGRNVIIGKLGGGEPNVTKDGVTVAKEINLENPIEDMGCQMVKAVASKTNDLAGDGTTTATVLAQAMVREGLKNVAAGANPMDLKRGMDKAVEAIIQDLNKQAKKVETPLEITQVASISANNDKVIGELISTGFEKVGKDGVLTVEKSKGVDTYVDVVEGMQFDRGYLSPYFATNTEKMTVELDNPFILMCDKKLANLKDVLPLLERIAKEGHSLLIICDNVEGEALSTLIVNKLNGQLKVAAIQSPGYQERRTQLVDDIAVLTGGTVAATHTGVHLSSITLERLGRAEKVIITRDSTTILGGAGTKDSIEARITEIRGQHTQASSEYEAEKYLERIAKLSGGIGVLYVGAASEVEMKEKKDRIDDALNATKAAVEEGIVVGGGMALLKALPCLDQIKTENNDETTGVNIIRKAISAPFRTILENAAEDASEILANINLSKQENRGYDVKNSEYCNMLEAGILDPKKVTRIALENASSVSSMIITTQCALIPKVVESAMDRIPTANFN